jgi:hypothetical protein
MYLKNKYFIGYRTFPTQEEQFEACSQLGRGAVTVIYAATVAHKRGEYGVKEN